MWWFVLAASVFLADYNVAENLFFRSQVVRSIQQQDGMISCSSKGANFCLVLFYVGECPKSRAFAPRWEKLATSLKDLTIVAAVDCDSQAKICDRYRVQSFPAIFFVNSGTHIEYHGSRSPKALQQFLVQSIQPSTSVTRVDVGTFAIWLKQMSRPEAVLLFTERTQVPLLFHSLAMERSATHEFGMVWTGASDAHHLLEIVKVAASDIPAIVVIRKNHAVKYRNPPGNSEWKLSSLLSFLDSGKVSKEYAVPLLDSMVLSSVSQPRSAIWDEFSSVGKGSAGIFEISPVNVDKFCPSSGKSAAICTVFIVKRDSELQRIAGIARKIAKELGKTGLGPPLNVLLLDAQRYPVFLEEMAQGGNGSLPDLILWNSIRNKVSSMEKPVSHANAQLFVGSLVAGNAKFKKLNRRPRFV